MILPVKTEPKLATEAKRLVNTPVTPFTRVETIEEKRLVAEVATSGPDIVVVPERRILRSSVMVVVVETPFIVLEMILPVEVEKVID